MCVRAVMMMLRLQLLLQVLGRDRTHNRWAAREKIIRKKGPPRAGRDAQVSRTMLLPQGTLSTPRPHPWAEGRRLKKFSGSASGFGCRRTFPPGVGCRGRRDGATVSNAMEVTHAMCMSSHVGCRHRGSSSHSSMVLNPCLVESVFTLAPREHEDGIARVAPAIRVGIHVCAPISGVVFGGALEPPPRTFEGHPCDQGWALSSTSPSFLGKCPGRCLAW